MALAVSLVPLTAAALIKGLSELLSELVEELVLQQVGWELHPGVPAASSSGWNAEVGGSRAPPDIVVD